MEKEANDSRKGRKAGGESDHVWIEIETAKEEDEGYVLYPSFSASSASS